MSIISILALPGAFRPVLWQWLGGQWCLRRCGKAFADKRHAITLARQWHREHPESRFALSFSL
jgi:hypothetical protein